MSIEIEPPPPEYINWHFYPSIRIGVTQHLNRTSRSTLRHVEFYVNGLIVQWNRIVDDLKESRRLMGLDLTRDALAAKVYSQLNDRLELDIHFYLICWDKIDKHLEKFVDSEGGSECIGVIWKEIKSLTSNASMGRHYFEHLDKRIVQGKPEGMGYFFSNYAGFTFRYIDEAKGGKRKEKQITLGRSQVEKVILAYEKILRCLGAGIPAGYAQSVNTEKRAEKTP